MNITILTEKKGWYLPHASELKKKIECRDNRVSIGFNHNEMGYGDVLFVLSYEKVIPSNHLKKHNLNLVVHASDLPSGKGWSPVTWQVLEGKDRIVVTLLEADESVDAGDIYIQKELLLNGTELNTEVKEAQAKITQELILEFLLKYPDVHPAKQQGRESFYPKRTPEDSELDISKTIDEQFNLLRVVDNHRYPAYFMKNGQKYILKIKKG